MQVFGCSSDAPEIIFHLRWIAKIALSVGAIAATGLWISLSLLTDNAGTTYGELIQSNNFVHAYLGPVLLIGGCVLLACAGVITWLIVLYSSFRIAGPLFRFSRNLERAMQQGPVKPIPIRAGDRLHQDAELLKLSFAAVETHCRALEQEIDRAFNAKDLAGLQSAADNLKRLVGRAHL